MELAFHEHSSEKQISQALVTVAVSSRFPKILMSETFPRNFFLNLCPLSSLCKEKYNSLVYMSARMKNLCEIWYEDHSSDVALSLNL
jgi:hypothetical protein